jgi:hypothetical protein
MLEEDFVVQQRAVGSMKGSSSFYRCGGIHDPRISMLQVENRLENSRGIRGSAPGIYI